MKPGERLSRAPGSRAVAEGASQRPGGLSATLEADVLDLFGWLRRKAGKRDDAPAPARRSIAQPVKGPMFTGRVEPMSHGRAAAPAPARKDSRARADGGRQPRARPSPGKSEAA